MNPSLPDHPSGRSPSRSGRRILVAAVLTAGLAAVPITATAHVRVHADSTAAGGFAQLTFRVPTESDTASTVKVEVQLPQDRPLLYVSTKPVPGWSVEATEATLPKPVEVSGTTITKAVQTVTWTADSAQSAIRPGEYQEFSVSAGPLPGPGDLLLPAEQTYSDGQVVAWDQPPGTNGEEPEHPAPVLTVTAADPAADPSAAPSGSSSGGPAAGAAAGVAAGGVDWVARGLGIAGLVVGAVGVGAAVLAVRRTSGRPAP